jgi:hypothetical protein
VELVPDRTIDDGKYTRIILYLRPYIRSVVNKYETVYALAKKLAYGFFNLGLSSLFHIVRKQAGHFSTHCPAET